MKKSSFAAIVWFMVVLLVVIFAVLPLLWGSLGMAVRALWDIYGVLGGI